MFDRVGERHPEDKSVRSDSRTKALAKLHDVSQSPYIYLRDLKRLGNRKLVGYVGLYVPEELIHAAGLVPVALPSSPDPVTVAGTRLQTNVCGYVRSIIDMAMKGELDMFEGFVWQDCCPTLRGGSDVMKRNTPGMGWLKVLWFPQVANRPQAGGFVVNEILEFKRLLEELAGREITANRLQTSIDIYNENRSLLRMTYSMRRLKPSPISACDMLAMVRSSMLMPKDVHIKLLRTVIEGLGNEDSTAENRQKLVISGSLCQAVPTELLDAVNAVDAVIADDDLYVGSRYTYGDVETLSDPLEALARRY